MPTKVSNKGPPEPSRRDLGLELLRQAKICVPDNFNATAMMERLDDVHLRYTLEKNLEKSEATDDQRDTAAKLIRAAGTLAAALRDVLALSPESASATSPDPASPGALQDLKPLGIVANTILNGMGPPASGTVLQGIGNRQRLLLMLGEAQQLAKAELYVRTHLAPTRPGGGPSADAELVGKHLPRLFEATFGRKCGVSINCCKPGPGLRFLVEAAKVCGMAGATHAGVERAVRRYREDLRKATVRPPDRPA